MQVLGVSAFPFPVEAGVLEWSTNIFQAIIEIQNLKGSMSCRTGLVPSFNTLQNSMWVFSSGTLLV